MAPIVSQSHQGMTDSTISKFTRVLPLSIRKEGGHGGSSGGGFSGSDSSSGNHHQGGEQKENIRISLSYPSPACGAMNPHKEITLRITNDENPLFYYYLKITEADYPELKSQQGLLVDFYGFPNQLLTLLEKCDVNYGSSNEDTLSLNTYSGGSGGAKFILVMKITGGNNNTVLDIVESNPFKYLCHLSLQISAGSDGEVKKYLCDVTTGLKKDLQLLTDKYNHLISAVETESGRMKEQLGQKLEEINSLRDQLHQQANSFSTKHFQDMTEEKEKLLKLQAALAEKFDQERSDLERRHSQAISTLEDRISSLENENRSLIQVKYKSETREQESSNKIKHYEEDLKLLQQEITLTKKQNEKLDRDYHEKQKTTGNLHNRVTLLETDLREKQGILQRQHEQITQLSEQKGNLEDHATAMVKEVERIKNVNKIVSGELIKANEIIKKLQDDIRSLNSKTKLQTQVTTEQERVIIDRDKTLGELQEKLSTLNSSLLNSSSEVQRLSSTIQENEIKIQELEKTIKSNENMISWLNKQLNEFQGLSNLSKFRQNLATSSTNQLASNENDQEMMRIRQQQMAAPPEDFARRGFSANSANGSSTLPGGTPSWMHIYQSTSTPLDDDLSSRLEKVQASSDIRMNYSELKSRFTDKVNGNTATAEVEKPSTVRAPTWAKGRMGKVTFGGPAKK